MESGQSCSGKSDRGRIEMKKIILLLTALITVFAVSCSSEKSPPASTENHKHLSEDQPAEEHQHQTLKLSEDQKKEWGIVVGSPQKQTAQSQIEVPGTLNLNQNKTAHISSFVRGQIESVSTNLGDQVRKGQPLLVVNSPDFAQTQADFLETRAKMIFSQQEYERAEMLYKEKAIEEKEFLKRKAEYEKLSTQLGALGSELHSYGITHEQIDQLIKKCESLREKEYKCEIAEPYLPILAPISGTVIFRDAVQGQHIEPDKILFTLSDLNTLWAELEAYEKDIPYIQKDSRVIIRSSLYPEKSFPAKIIYFSELIDPKLRTIQIRADVKNKEHLLKPNMYITGLIQSQNIKQEVLIIPEEAVQNLNGEKVVFVLNPKQEFEVRHITLGEQIRDQRVISKGLTEEDRIVVKGAFTLKSELNKADFGHQHTH
ncbi:MAG: efflux RND transporter periplasmic adaptor subunit [Candidatus Aminicenantes bacterium]|nr:efflux RND transporter periplasmic adaptor subunit [Candidatus Aminicenantes bacterium]